MVALRGGTNTLGSTPELGNDCVETICSESSYWCRSDLGNVDRGPADATNMW